MAARSGTAGFLETMNACIRPKAVTRVRYYGRYSSRARGPAHERLEVDEPDADTHSHARQAAKAAWARLLRSPITRSPTLPEPAASGARSSL